MKAGDLTVGSEVLAQGNTVQCGRYRRYGAACSVAGTVVMEQRAVWQVTPCIAEGTDVMERRAVVIFRVDNTSQMILNDL